MHDVMSYVFYGAGTVTETILPRFTYIVLPRLLLFSSVKTGYICVTTKTEDTMNVKQKLKALSYIRKRISEQLNHELTFICNEFNDWVEDNLYEENEPLPTMDDEFPELKTEIIRVGTIHDPHYRWLTALDFKDEDGSTQSIHGQAGREIYNRQKLNIISDVRQQLTKGKY